MSRYYDDLSGDSSIQDDDESTDSADDFFLEAITETAAKQTRCIIHVDVDCFYCQCECLDRKIPPDRPFAIGQKHIVVTCNYEARKYGVSKLQLREEAYRKCPSLLIIEGSDLERYRIHARRIYESFRKACQEQEELHVPVCKGSMDEMVADLTNYIDTMALRVSEGASVYVYGEEEERTVLTEDQTGASSVVVTAAAKPRLHATSYQSSVIRRLHMAAQVGIKIRECILQETGFTTTMGVSVNPLLAKIASGLRKPATCNILYPWRAVSLVQEMPLRKIPGVGSRTMNALCDCLLDRHGKTDQSKPIWRCKDLLQVSRDEIIASLEKVKSFEKSSREHADIILQKCHGVDKSPVVDDQGGLPKTLSVENSFRRGTITTEKAVCDAMEDLYRRLPRLLHERATWSAASEQAYPTTLRLAVRSVVHGKEPHEALRGKRRRPFITRSKQIPFDGEVLLRGKAPEDQLRRLVEPLLRSLVLSANDINVTKLNVAVADFRDIVRTPRCEVAAVPPQSQTAAFNTKGKSAAGAASAHGQARDKQSKPTHIESRAVFAHLTADQMDPCVLAELPEEIATEVQNSLRNSKPLKRRRIDHFFAPRNRK